VLEFDQHIEHLLCAQYVTVCAAVCPRVSGNPQSLEKTGVGGGQKDTAMAYTACNMQQTTDGMQRTTDDVQRTACNRRQEVFKPAGGSLGRRRRG
jgi:hypothetical protein